MTPSAPHLPGWLAWTLPLLIPILWPMVKRFIVSRIVDEFVRIVNVGLEEGDADDDQLIYAAVRWVEAKSKKLGLAGPDRFKTLASNLCSRVRYLAGHDAAVAELMEDVVDEVGKAAHAVESKEPPPSQPDAP